MKTKFLFGFTPFLLMCTTLTHAQTFVIPDFPDFPEPPAFQIPDMPSPPSMPTGAPSFPESPNFPNNNTNGTNTVRVTIVKFVDGQMATPLLTNNTVFGMNSTYNSASTGQGSGDYALAPFGYNGNLNAYRANTVPLEIGASYATNEILNSNVGSSCQATSSTSYTPFALQGYTVGNSLEEAINGNISPTSPNFTNLTSDKYIIVWNDNCATIENGILKLNSIETVSNSGVANNTFENGFKYIFNLTIPNDELNLYMKFSDWTNTSGQGSIPVAGNTRISSAQASSTMPIIISGANMYSTTSLGILGDLDATLAGKQIKVLVETRIPVGTPNGTYSASYGVKTQ